MQNRNRKLLWFCFFFWKIIISSIFAFALFATVLYREDFPNVSTGTGRSRRRILRVWGLGREPQQAWKAGVQRRIFRKWRAICPACHFCGKGNLARHLHCLPNLPFKKISHFVRQNAPAYYITLIEGSFKNSSLKYETKVTSMSY